MTDEYVTVAEAREILGVSKYKMTDLIKRGKLETIENEADRRSRLIRRADVEALARHMKVRTPPKSERATAA